MTALEIGRLLRSGTSGFVAGCRVPNAEAPSFGALVRAPMPGGDQVYGLIHDIHIDDDGLVRQLATAESVSAEVLRDNRERRIVPIELSVLAVGYEEGGRIHHALPPRPPLSLDVIHLCSTEEMRRFTETLGYVRLILNAKDLPVSELLAAHVRQAQGAHVDKGWRDRVVQEVIRMLRDDHAALMSVLEALAEAA